MDLTDFAVPYGSGQSVRQIEERWDQISSQPDLAAAIYQKALFWKKEQHRYYRQLESRLRQQ
jgi:hypothetical protein